ncbi:hypothetical protein PMAYCL1PPCAC_22653, partial [Pristionchus mayeri]
KTSTASSRDNVSTLTFSTTQKPGKSCVPSMLRLNLSASDNNPTVVFEKNTGVESNIPGDCHSQIFDWSVDDVKVDASSPIFSLSLSNGQVTRVCLSIESKTACGYVKYDILSPATTTTVSVLTGTLPIDPHLKDIQDKLNNLITTRCSNRTNGRNLIEELANLKDPNKIVDTLSKVLQGFDVSENGMELRIRIRSWTRCPRCYRDLTYRKMEWS